MKLRPGTYLQPCGICGVEFKVRPSEVKKARQRGCRPPTYCSLTCRNVAYAGEGNPKWRGGRSVTASGYVLVHAPGHPHQSKGTVPEHRLVMERHIGRYLEPQECVHHLNHNRSDNRIENLELMASWAEHQRRHGYYEPRKCRNCGVEVMRSRARRRAYPKGSYCSRKCAAAGASRANAEKAKSRGLK